MKSVTSKPVVTVGRFTSPDTMASQLRRGVCDLIGAARPSIADPFLPKKIEEGRIEDIRECIGCNICYSGDSLGVPIRCTQNPTMGEEWRKGWHPEHARPTLGGESVLIIGAGPAGLEAARALGRRGYNVMLAEAGRELGGRILGEAALPGMGTYIRVRDYRVQQIEQMPQVEVYRESEMTPEDVLALEVDHVAIATGATWRRDRFDGKTYVPVADKNSFNAVLTPDDIMAGSLPTGDTVLFDADGYYMGSVIAERLRAEGLAVTYVTPADQVAPWAEMTSEAWRVRTRLMELGVRIIPSHRLTWFAEGRATLACQYTDTEQSLDMASVVMVTQRRPNDGLYQALMAHAGGEADKLPFRLQRLGDCEAPSIIAAAVYAGHRYAQDIDAQPDPDQPLKHDRIDVGHATL